jgi:hypothetical protein
VQGKVWTRWEGPRRPKSSGLRSCFLIYLFESRDLVRLRTFGALDDVELYFITLFEALISLTLNGTVVNEDIGSAFAAEESVTFCVVEPLYCALILCQWSGSLICRLEPAAYRQVKALQR